jgi:hypothetical protein
MNGLVYGLDTPEARSALAVDFRRLHAVYPRESTTPEGEGIYSGINSALRFNMERLVGIYTAVGTKLRKVQEEVTARCRTRGFTESQIKVIVMFFKLRVVFAERPDAILTHPQTGLWAVPVDEPINCQKPWPKVCEMLGSSAWIHDVMPFTVLSHLLCNVVIEMHRGPGLATAVLAELESESAPYRLLYRMVLDAQIPLRATLARTYDKVGEDGDFTIPATVREERFDNAVLLRIVKFTDSNRLFGVTSIPKLLFESKSTGLFACCDIQLASYPGQVWETCLEIKMVRFVFGKQPNFNDLLQEAVIAS